MSHRERSSQASSSTSRAFSRDLMGCDTLRLGIIAATTANDVGARSATSRRMRGADETVPEIAVDICVSGEGQVTALGGLVKTQLAVTHGERYGGRRR